MDPKKVTLVMTFDQFQTVHGLLSQFVQAYKDDPESFSGEAQEDVKNIEALEFTFSEK